ncbi:SacI homology domain-containing protein [Gautieria morchelliformis]|nr:SacI homology domain-containing protein [Gautieria morchelliformis]
MKRLFSRRKSSQPSTPGDPPSTHIPASRSVSLRPKFLVPPLPHPCPYASIHVLVTTHGLMLSPDLHSDAQAVSYVRISWGKDAVVDEIEVDKVSCTANTTVHGIVGILRLFHASYLLVITSCTEVGDLFDESRTVFKVDGVSAIPLEQTRAAATVNMLASLNTHPSAPTAAKPTPPRADTDTSDVASGHVIQQNSDDHSDSTPSPHVSFAPEERRPMISPSLLHEEPDIPTPPSSNSSGHSTPNPSFPTSPVAKALAARLSFWSRQPTSLNASASEAAPSLDMVNGLEHRMETGAAPTELLNSIIASTAPAPSTIEERHSELDEKIVRETAKEFAKGGMFFSYSFDITTSLQRKQQQIAKLKQRSSLLSDLQALDEQPRVSLSSEEAEEFPEPQPLLPLWRRVDRKFWWNESLSRPFIDAGLHSYVLPIMQGYYQIASFRIPSSRPLYHAPTSDGDVQENVDAEGDQTSHTVDYVLVSRRSRERAGLRYQRRGIDDDANVANFVETETIMRIKREGRSNVFSHIQIRGSIPLFWTQSGYGLKPPPQLSTERTPSQSMDALKRHFGRTLTIYGPLAVVNLTEQHGKEGALTAAFRESMGELGSSDIQYHEYDFHAETKGMRYENISKLITKLERTFESQGFFWVSGGIVMSQQKGAFRVNCIDCLDRTNVVQSAFARSVLQDQLAAVALASAYEAGDRTEADVVFNDVWANNGDAISRA